MHGYPLHILQKLTIECLYMFMMGYVFLEYYHLSTSNTGTYVTHTIVISNSLMLIVWI